MKTDTIEKDVSKEKEQEIVDPREQLVESIVQKNDEDRDKYAEEMGLETDKDETLKEEPKDDIKPDDEPKEDEDPKEEEPKDEMVEIIVDGEKQEVPLSKIKDAGVRSLQKESAAANRLREATKLLKEAKQTVKPPKDKDADEDDKGTLTTKEITHAIQYGTEDEAEAAIEQLNNMGRKEETVTPEDVKKIATDTVKESQDSEKIFNKFNLPEKEGGFDDLTKDPYLMSMAIAKVNERLKKGESNSWETYEEAGKEVREWVSGFSNTDVKEDKESDFDKKKDKKKNTDAVRAANVTKSSEDKDPKPKTATETIMEMQKNRPGGG